MTISLDSLAAEVAALRTLDGRTESELTSAEFDDYRNGMGRVRRAYDAVAASMAHELARRSNPSLGVGGLARQDGFSNAQQSLGKTLGITPGQASNLIEAGRALAPREPSGAAASAGPDVESARGEQAATSVPRFPHVAAALLSAAIGADAASLLTRTLDSITKSYSAEALEAGAPQVPATPGAEHSRELEELERRLVEKARTLGLSELRRVCGRERAWRFPKDLAAKERIHRENRALYFHEDPEGMVMMTARMDPASAAPIRAYVDAQTRWAFQQRRNTSDGGVGIEDERNAGQIRLDAMTSLALHGLGCTSIESGVKTTVIIRINERDLEDDLALGECDQVAGPISVGTLRSMAVDAGIIPLVMGGKSLPLDLGQLKRLFTPAQRLALVERDGGCSWCHAPPSFCEAHHIRWWGRDGGPTDLKNGVLLCTRCHHRVHRDGWKVEVVDDEVQFTTPDSRERRFGGRAHLELAAETR
ncbi:DUF222 domain-containing protein [Demequina aurantiaca]|uniref:HNH endonuclease n=1 Tax=Demequina aurantiaca TaxID=676200 RepID=UPI003D334AF8